MNIKNMFNSFRPGLDTVSPREKFRSASAAMLALFLLGEILSLLPNAVHPLLLLPPMAAASVLLYAAPHSPLAQPWPHFMGNILSGLLGWLCGILIPDLVLAGALAGGLAILVMHLSRSLHPPGAASAIVMALNAKTIQQIGWGWGLGILLMTAIFSIGLALIINRLMAAGRYPAQHQLAAPQVQGAEGLSIEDIEWALVEMNNFIDADEEDLLEIYQLASKHSKSRKQALR